MARGVHGAARGVCGVLDVNGMANGVHKGLQRGLRYGVHKAVHGFYSSAGSIVSTGSTGSMGSDKSVGPPTRSTNSMRSADCHGVYGVDRGADGIHGVTCRCALLSSVRCSFEPHPRLTPHERRKASRARPKVAKLSNTELCDKSVGRTWAARMRANHCRALGRA